MGLTRRPGSFHVGSDTSHEESIADSLGSSFAAVDLSLFQLQFRGLDPAFPPASPREGTDPNSVLPPLQTTHVVDPAAIHDVVFIDSRVPDIQDLLNGLEPGEKAFIIDGNSDGLDQIAAILTSQHLTKLTGIQIVAHGGAGQLDVGSTVLNDADLASHAAPLSAIGASLAPGGDLALYACDTAAGAMGHQFIADLSAFAGGVDVAAATHLVGSTDLGGSWTLDASTGPAATATAPFTAASLASYSGVLSTTPGEIFFTTFDPSGNTPGNTAVIGVHVDGSAGATNPTTLASAATTGGSFYNLFGIATDTANGKYFLVDSATSLSTPSTILESNISGGPVSPIYTSAAGAGVFGMRFDAQNGKLYFAQVDPNDPTDKALTGIYTMNEDGTGLQKLVSFTGADSANGIAIDTADNLLFFTDGGFPGSPVESVGVANLTTGAIISTNLFSIANPTSQLVGGIDVDPVNHKIYWTTFDANVAANNEVFSATFSTGASATLSSIIPIYTGSTTAAPYDVAIDAADGIFYTAITDATSGSGTFKLVEGNLNGTGTPTTVYSASGYNPVFESLELAPTLTLSGAAPTALKGGPAVTLDSAATVVDSTQNIASATVSITGGLASGDTLSFGNGANHITFGDGHTINASFSGSTLSLAGIAAAADYQSALETIAFSTTSSNSADRTVSWSVSDGNLSSATSTSTVHVLGPPAVTNESHTPSSGSHIDAGKTVTFSVTFSAPVTVTTGSSGAPTLQLNDSEVATYSSGSATNTLTFSYTVQPGDTVSDLKATSFVALPTGTTIKDGSGQDADLNGFTAIDTGVQVDTTAPSVTSVGVPANATYVAGQDLDFTVHLSEAVTVTGMPEIALTLVTGGTVDAQYISGSGTSALTFRYAVIGGEADTNGIGVGNAIILNGGTVQDAATNAAVLTLNNVGSTAGVLVDSIPPAVSSVSVPTDGVYGAGQALNFTVNFSENVLVTTGGGAPYIDVTLDTGGTVHAVYTGGSGTSALTFSYTIASGNDDANGIAVGSSINLNGGTINDAATNAAVLTLNSVGSTTGVLVHAILPTVSSIDTVDNSTNNLGTEHFTVTFSEAVTGVDASEFTLVGTGTVGGAITSVSGSGTTWTVTVGNVVGDGTLRLDLNNTGDAITDTYGNTLTAAHTGDQSYTIEHTAPAVTGVTVPANATYVARDHLDFTTTFSEVVTVTGTPRIALTLDTGGTVYATYVSGSGTNTLTFRDVVATGQQDLTGITTAPAIDLNGGTIKDAATNDAALTLNGEPSTAGIDVDAIVPAVSSVSVPSNGTYGTGQDLDFTVNFTKVVTVNTGGGVPYVQVTLDTGGTVDATYLSGSGTSALAFRYVVASGELDSNGITVGSNLVLNNGTIQDAIGNSAATALNNVGSTTGVLVDSILPTVSSIDTVDNNTNNLSTEHFTVTFSTDVSLNPPGTTDFTLHTTGTAGGTIASVTAFSGSTYTVTVTGVTGDGTMRLDLNTSGSTITDAFGNPVTAAHTGDQSYTIEHTPPSATAMTVPADGTYGEGQSLDFTTTFSEPVTVDTRGGTPRIALTLDTGGTIYATYLSGSGTNTLTFQHTVLAGEQDLTGIVTGTAIDLNGGTIKDAASNNAVLAINAVEPSTAGVDVDAIVPAVTSVGVPANATYIAGQDLDFTVNTNKNVTVDTTGGTPYITLTLDTGGTVDATYISGSGTSALTFRYVVVSGNLDNNGITVGISLTMAGGTIRDAHGNDAALTLAGVGSTTGVLVDAVPPTVSSIDTVQSSINNHSTEDFTVTFSETVTGVDNSDFTLHDTGTVSGTIASVTAVNGSTYTVTVNNVVGNGTMRLDLNSSGTGIADLATNSIAAGYTAGQTYTIDHAAPVVTITSPGGTLTSGTVTIAGTVDLADALSTVVLTEGTVNLGSLVTGADGSWSKTVTLTGYGSQTVTASDADAAGNVGSAQVSYVLPPPSEPAVTATFVTTSMSLTTDAAHGVLANAFDPFAHPLSVTTIDGDAAGVGHAVAGTYGSLTLNSDGSYTYILGNISTAPTGSYLDDHFTFTATVDGYTLSSSLDVILDRPPVVSDADARLPVASSSLASDASHGVLAGAADADGDTLAVSAVAGNSSGVGHSVSGQFGDLTLNADGSYAYSLTANATAAHGDDVFTFQVSDGHGGTTSASLDIAIGTDPSLFGSVTHDPGSPGGETYLLYDALFGRSPDPLGLEFWAAALKAGTTADQLASDLINSDEHTQAFPNQSNTDFVDQIYQTALHRAPDAAGLASWVNALDQGASKADVLLGIANSPEHIADLQGTFSIVTYDPGSPVGETYLLYDALFGRSPDPLGLEFWTAALKGGTTADQLASDLINSDEHTQAFPNQSNTDFVDQIYQTALHRAPDAAGLASWVNALDQGASKADVLLGIANSPEHIADLQGTFSTGVFVPDQSDAEVARLYQGILGRAPDSDGFKFNEIAIAQGTTLTQVATDMLASSEYLTANVGQTDMAFVESLYNNALGRDAEQAGLVAWVKALGSGTSRATVAVDISESPEAQQHLVGHIETGFHLS
jgi:VCBS repeat-containing protein